MRRPLVALVAALTSILVVGAIATAVTTSVRHNANDARSHPMMSTRAGTGQLSDRPAAGWGSRATYDEFSYLTHMVAHHQDAVAAARQLARSDRPQMRAFGRRIVATQSAQIEQMKGWLAAWYAGRPVGVGYQPMMRDLTGLSGDRLDRAFLQDMLVHHMAPVMTSQQLLAAGAADHPHVETLARTIRSEQHAEIFQMRDWLVSWFGTGALRGPGGWQRGTTGMGPGMMW